MTNVRDFIKRHPVSTYFRPDVRHLMGRFLLVVGPGGFASASWQTEAVFLPAVLAMPLSLPKLSAISPELRGCPGWRVTRGYPEKAFIRRFLERGALVLIRS
jgi:hypothetical protein